MVSPFSSFSVIYALAFLLPGFITYKTTKRFGEIVTEEDRFDKAIYTVGASGFSLILGLVGYQLLSGGIDFSIGQEYAPIELGGIYLLSVISSFLLGYVFGKLYSKYYRRSVDIRRPPVWNLKSEHREEPARVRVVMRNGRKIWGEIYVNDSEIQGHDLILQYPEQIVRHDDGSILKRVNLDKYVFLSGNQISEIYYETELKI